VVAVCTLFLLVGIKESARLNMAMTAINLSVILFVIIFGAFHIDTNNWSPFLPYGIQGAWRGVATVFFSYVGIQLSSILDQQLRI
jgi:APA family basic amino acid/polyamine antiporter